MTLLIRDALLLDPEALSEARGDLLVIDRSIAAVGANLPAPDGATVLDARGAHLCPGLVDAGVFRADAAAATAGGVTACVLMPDQSPPLDDPALIERAERLGKPDLWVHPLAAATRGLHGRELAELALMRDAGAVGVATGRAAIADANVMLRLLRYAAGLGLVVVSHPEDAALTAGMAATEGDYATRHGLPAAPAAAEAIQVARDIRLAREAGAKLHFACITTAEGADLVRRARAAGQDVTAAATPEHLLLNDTAVAGWRTYARLSPPLRSESDRLALRGAVRDGTLAMIASRHDPRSADEKRLPFADAAPGSAGQPLLLAMALTLWRDDVLPLPRLVAALTLEPARRFGLPGGRLRVGAPADLCLFDAGAPWRVDSDRLPGRAGNTPFDGLPVQGRVRAVVKGGELLPMPGGAR